MKNKKSCALAELPTGCRARISGVEGEGDIRARLSAMGLTPDTDIEVLDCACGKQVVRVRGCNIVLDGETACRVTCSAPQEENEQNCRGLLGKWRNRRGRGKGFLWDKQ